jgi:two-component system, NtrC family, sensor histidine kinase PilS
MVQRAPDSGLYRKLVWINLFRVVTVTVLLGGTVVVSWQSPTGPEGALSQLYLVVIATYVLTIAFSVALRLRLLLTAVAYAQIALDVGIAAVVARLTGGIESVFVFMFSLAVVNGAILLYRRGAILAAGLAVAGYLVTVTTAPGPPLRAETLFAHSTAFVLTAALASYLADQLRTTGESLATITGLYQSIIQSMTSGLATLDPAGRVTYLNPAGEAMAGLSLVRVRNQPAAQVFPAFEAATGRGEVEHVSPGGQRMLLGYSSFPLVGPRSRPLGTAVIFQDLTRLRAMEEAMARSARLADLGGVAAGLAHELRNPLASISGCVELLRAQAASDEEGGRLMEIVLRETARLDQLVSDFLQFSRPAPLKREPVDLALLLSETLDVFAHDPVAAGLEVARALVPAPAECDADRIRQVAWNLLLNAAQAMKGRGSGRITVHSGPAGGGQVTFSIEDDGPGIAAADLERIFLPFYTTKERGSGLGLANVHRVIDAHGGRIGVESEPGRGARFQVWLPGGQGAAAGAGTPVAGQGE